MPVDANGEELIEIHVCIFRSVNDGARTPVFTLIRAAFADRQFEESGQAVVMHARSRLAGLYEEQSVLMLDEPYPPLTRAQLRTLIDPATGKIAHAIEGHAFRIELLVDPDKKLNADEDLVYAP